MESFIAYFGCGEVRIRNEDNTLDFRCRKFFDIKSKIIPFFKNLGSANILGVKSADFNDWCEVSEIVDIKGHLTKEGLDQILAEPDIKSGMNKGRSEYFSFIV